MTPTQTPTCRSHQVQLAPEETSTRQGYNVDVSKDSSGAPSTVEGEVAYRREELRIELCIDSNRRTK